MNEKIDLLKDYLYNIPQITMSFIFGSYSKNQHTIDSDIDIAVYFKPKDNLIEWEETIIYPMEDEIWTNIERILNIETDFIVLNRASSNLALSIISDGVALFIKDNAFYLRFYLLISSAAEYFRDFTKDFYLIKNRSLSLSEIDRDRLIRLTDFLETELNDYPQFINISQKDYLSNSSTRRNTERWIENL
ncbi:MAG: nucleotidyltransferase domain-containing protein, partial [Spirochaetota bacterium]|nr:nucleotidyltransferase domain-containing protein [Spirochaetota bacterium]